MLEETLHSHLLLELRLQPLVWVYMREYMRGYMRGYPKRYIGSNTENSLMGYICYNIMFA